MKRSRSVALSIPALGLLLAAGLSAQAPAEASLRGQVVDSITGEPMEGVLLRMDTGPETLSDEHGRFRLIGLRPGRHMLALLTPDCRITWGQVYLAPGEEGESSFRLPPVYGQAEREAKERDRRRRSNGKLVTAADIEKMHATSMSEVIRRVMPNMVGGRPEEAGSTTRITARAPRSFIGDAEPVVVVDGVRVQDGARVLDLMRPSEVAELEILPSSAGGWEFGSSGASGVIRVTTKRGGGDASASGAQECVVPGFPRGGV